MEFVDITAADIRVSRIGLGTWAIGGWMWGGTDDDAAIATIRRALDLGVTLIDTAPAYGQGHAEEVVGRALEGRRDAWSSRRRSGSSGTTRQSVIATRRRRIRKEIDDSLRRLQTDYIDIYQVHWPDPRRRWTRPRPRWPTLYDIGKIRAIGVSNFSPAQMERVHAVRAAAHRAAAVQSLRAGSERDVLPYAARTDRSHSPMARCAADS